MIQLLSLQVVATGLASLALSALSLAAEPKPSVEKPNIVFFLVDDLGIDGCGCYGSDVYKERMPNVDALAKGGVRFEACYASPLCGPSRCMLMTGRYAFRTGGLTNQSWRENGTGAVAKDEHPIARLLRENGYATCQSGKWRQIGETPRDWGFDEFLRCVRDLRGVGRREDAGGVDLRRA